MTKSFIASLVFNGAGAGFLIYVIKQVWNKDKWTLYCYNKGVWVSQKLRKRLGKSFAEAIEKFLQERLTIATQNFDKGLDADDNNGGNNK